jgi:hypothetical protein
MGRQFAGVDQGQVAISTMRKRLGDADVVWCAARTEAVVARVRQPRVTRRKVARAQ